MMVIKVLELTINLQRCLMVGGLSQKKPVIKVYLIDKFHLFW